MSARGFTLVEMLAVITISAILVALAIPSFQGTVRSSRISGATNSFIAALDLARSEAIRRAVVVTVCRSVDSMAVAPACSNAAANGFAANDWASGWISFAKAPGNIAFATVEAGDEIILRQEAFVGPPADRMIIESTAPNPQSRSFNPRGLTVGGGAIGITLFFDHRDIQVAQRTERARCVAMNITGRSRVARVDVPTNTCPAA
jgi:prepilin-type N-terminal cleavage/methylation domain-containing protein